MGSPEEAWTAIIVFCVILVLLPVIIPLLFIGVSTGLLGLALGVRAALRKRLGERNARLAAMGTFLLAALGVSLAIGGLFEAWDRPGPN